MHLSVHCILLALGAAGRLTDGQGASHTSLDVHWSILCSSLFVVLIHPRCNTGEGAEGEEGAGAEAQGKDECLQPLHGTEL